MGTLPDRPRNCETCTVTSVARHKGESSSLHMQHLISAAKLQETTKCLHPQFRPILQYIFILSALAKLWKATISLYWSVYTFLTQLYDGRDMYI